MILKYTKKKLIYEYIERFIILYINKGKEKENVRRRMSNQNKKFVSSSKDNKHKQNSNKDDDEKGFSDVCDNGPGP